MTGPLFVHPSYLSRVEPDSGGMGDSATAPSMGMLTTWSTGSGTTVDMDGCDDSTITRADCGLEEDDWVEESLGSPKWDSAIYMASPQLPSSSELLIDGPNSTELDLTQVEDIILKKDGQKADDAPVPTQIWENHFRDTLPLTWSNAGDSLMPSNRVYPLHPMWRSRLDNYRVLGICFWRRRVC